MPSIAKPHERKGNQPTHAEAPQMCCSPNPAGTSLSTRDGARTGPTITNRPRASQSLNRADSPGRSAYKQVVLKQAQRAVNDVSFGSTSRFCLIACVTPQKLHTHGHHAGLNLRGQCPITGVDLTRIDGIDGQTAQTIVSAICRLRQNSIRVARIMAFWPFQAR